MKMRYIIMCGGAYPEWETPRQLTPINGEPVVARTIRLLRENGVDDIAISSNHPAFSGLGVPVLTHDNPYVGGNDYRLDGLWIDAFYPTVDPVCYLFGDVVFSPEAVRHIVNDEPDGISFFASAPPFGPGYGKQWAEPFAFKVADTEKFWRAIANVRRLWAAGKFNRRPIAWELWNVIQRGPDGDVNTIDFWLYSVINDYTCDIDVPEDVERFRGIV